MTTNKKAGAHWKGAYPKTGKDQSQNKSRHLLTQGFCSTGGAL